MKNTILTLYLFLFGMLVYSQSKVQHHIIDYLKTDTIIRFQVDSHKKGFNIFRRVENNLLYTTPESSLDTILYISNAISNSEYKTIDDSLLNHLDTLIQYYDFPIKFDSSSYWQCSSYLKNSYIDATIYNDLTLSYHIDKLNIDKKNEEILGRYYCNYLKGLGMIVRFFSNMHVVEMEVILFKVNDFGNYNIVQHEFIELPEKKSKKIIEYSCVLEKLDCISCPYFNTETIYTSKNRFTFSYDCIRNCNTKKIPKELKKTIAYTNYLLMKYSTSQEMFNQSFFNKK